jgi:hypothetical protein
MTSPDEAIPPAVVEALAAIQRLVNQAVEQAAAPVPSGSASGTWGFTGTAVGFAPELTPDRVEALRAFVGQVRAGTVRVAIDIGILEGCLQFADRVGDLLP